MKRFFIFVSSFVIASFMIWQLVETPDLYLYDRYSNINIDESGANPVNKGQVEQTLNELALESNSLIVKRIPEPTGTGHRFVYEKYGDLALPNYLTKASEEMSQVSSVYSQYRIMQGSLTEEQLAEKFRSLGYQPKIEKRHPTLVVVMNFLLNNSTFLSLLIFLLTFSAMTVISRIKELRAVGIRLISGESMTSIIFKSIRTDGINIGFSFLLCGSVGILVLFAQNILGMGLWRFLLLALFLYSLLLFGISVFLSGIYVLGLKRQGIMEVIKGKLPVNRLLAVIVVCQFLAILMVGFGIGRIPIYYAEWQEENQASAEWSDQKDKVNLGFGFSAFATENQEEQEKSAKVWYTLLKEAFEENRALLVQNNLLSFMMSEKNEYGDTLESYTPDANTLYVSPNYFDLEKIKLDDTTRERINHLKLGEFGLILPDKLKKDATHYQEIYEKYMSQYAEKDWDDSSEKLYDATAILGFLPGNQERFIYNNLSVSPKQFLTDPIIVVTTPAAMGNALDSIMIFWGNAIDYSIFFSGYQQTTQLLKKYQVYDSVSSITSSQQCYEEQVDFYRNQIITFLASAILGFVTSVLLFNSMNLLYFEEFRRDIFIKRISGMSFTEIHQMYMMIQGTLLAVGFAVTFLLTRNLGTSLLTLFLFALNAFVILYTQSLKENKQAMTIMKGK